MFIYGMFSFFSRPLLMLECMDMNRLQIAGRSSFWTPRELKCLKHGLQQKAASQTWLKGQFAEKTSIFHGKNHGFPLDFRWKTNPLTLGWLFPELSSHSHVQPTAGGLYQHLAWSPAHTADGFGRRGKWQLVVVKIRRFNHRNMGSSPGKMMDEHMDYPLVN